MVVLSDPVARLEQTLSGRKAYEMLQSALVLLDIIGADIAGAHVSQAIHALHNRFDLEANRSKTDQALHLPFPGS